MLGQAPRRGGINCPLGSFPQRLWGSQVQGSSPEVLRSAELLLPSAVGGLCVTPCPHVLGEPRVEGLGFGTAGAPHPAPSTNWSPAAGPGWPRWVQGRCQHTPSPPPEESVTLWPRRGPGPRAGAWHPAPVLPRKPLGLLPFLLLAAFSFSLNFLGLFFLFLFYPFFFFFPNFPPSPVGFFFFFFFPSV